MTKFFITLLSIFALTQSVCAQSAILSQTQASYIELENPEDFIQIPETPWLLISSMKSPQGTGGALYAINSQDPDLTHPQHPATDKQDNGEVLPADFNPHGITLFRDNSGITLFVVHHGVRESIESYSLHLENGRPAVVWQHSVMMPQNTWANAVATLGHREFLVTSMFDPHSDFLQRFDRKNITGQVWRWNNLRWQPAFAHQFSGANGIEISADGRWVIVSEWAAQKVHRFSLTDETAHDIIEVDFLPDNLHRMASGEILLSGQNTCPSTLFSCEDPGKGPCPQPYTVLSIQPADFTARVLVRKAGDEDFGAGTAAIQVTTDKATELWVGTVTNDRISRFIYPES
jgi:hypothetical protein